MRCSRVYSCGRKGRARMGRVMIPGAGGLCTASCLGYCPAADLCLTGFKMRDDCQTVRAGRLQCASWACGIWIAGFWPAATAFTHSSPRSATHIPWPAWDKGTPEKGMPCSCWPPDIGWLCLQVILSSTRAFWEPMGVWGGSIQTRPPQPGQTNLLPENLALQSSA